ncbi:MAG: HAD family phosphatase [Tannerella sp.]|jgi:putative hydrolase of the HAD superfamily|nr:HAD family phosphatase [Tannerella sp.]
MIRNIVFDMGGVLVDVHRERAIRQFQSIGVRRAAELIDSSHHSGIFLAIEDGSIDADTFCRRLCAEAGRAIPREAIEQAWQSIVDPPAPYRLDCVLELRKRYRTFVLSNNNPILMDGWARTARFSAAGRPVTDYFDRVYVSYEMKCVKPDMAIYRMMVADSGIVPSETLFLDDSRDNIRAGEAAGFRTHLVRNGEDWRGAVSAILEAEGRV